MSKNHKRNEKRSGCASGDTALCERQSFSPAEPSKKHSVKHATALVKRKRLTERLPRDDPGVLAGHGRPGVPFAYVLDESVTLVHRTAHDLAVLGEDDLDVGLLHDGGVEVADKHPGVEGARVVLVGDIAGLTLSRHFSPVEHEQGRHQPQTADLFAFISVTVIKSKHQMMCGHHSAVCTCFTVKTLTVY